MNDLQYRDCIKDSNRSYLERRIWLAATAKELSQGVPAKAILNRPILGSLLLRKQMNRQLFIICLPVEILSMIFQEYVTSIWMEDRRLARYPYGHRDILVPSQVLVPNNVQMKHL